MGIEATRQEGRNRWLVGAGWVAGIGIALVEMQMGMDYVQENLVPRISAILGWLPILGTLVCRCMGTSAAHYHGMESMMRLMLLTSVPCGLCVLGLVRKQRAAE